MPFFMVQVTRGYWRINSFIIGWPLWRCRTQYCSQYCALFALVHEYMGCDLQEIAHSINTRLRKIRNYFCIREIKTKNLFIY